MLASVEAIIRESIIKDGYRVIFHNIDLSRTRQKNEQDELQGHAKKNNWHAQRWSIVSLCVPTPLSLAATLIIS